MSKKAEIARIDEAVAEARRFIAKAKAAKEAILETEWAGYPLADRAAMKRASMDLTRALARLRAREASHE